MSYVEQQEPSVLCPLLGSHPRHEQWVQVQNGIYGAIPRDGENVILDYAAFQDQLKTAASAMGIYSETPNYMHLYRSTATPRFRERGTSGLSPFAYIEAWFLQCPTCHFVLPASVCER